MTYDPLRPGELAAVVTFLEMHEAPVAASPASELCLERIQKPDAGRYRALFRRIGAPWLWFSRLVMEDAKLAEIIEHPGVVILAVRDQAKNEVGIVELDFREAGQCELAFIGLVPELAGRGHGRWLLAEALRRAWREGIVRVHVHTCSLDHPAALSAYRRAGFVPFKRAIERFPDPRLLGILPRDCAAQIPLIG